jgi:predicted dehydrogenase
MNDIRIGIIGSGFMGKTFAEAFTKYVQGARLVAITGGSRAEGLAQEYKANYEPTIERLISRDDADAVCIATPQHLHIHQAAPAANAGKHILLEKPMATTVADCKVINKACADAGVNLMLSFTQRYRICNIEAKRLIDEGAIGKIKVIQETMVNANGINVYPQWQHSAESKGTLLAYGCHSIDHIRWLTKQEVEWVAAHYLVPPGVQAEYTANVFMGLTENISATLLCENECPPPGIPTRGFHAYVIGEKGVLSIDAYGELQILQNGKWEVVAKQPPIDWVKEGRFNPTRLEAYTKQCQEFVNSIVEKRPPAVTGIDGEKAVEVALAAYRSAELKQSVRLPFAE